MELTKRINLIIFYFNIRGNNYYKSIIKDIQFKKKKLTVKLQVILQYQKSLFTAKELEKSFYKLQKHLNDYFV